MVNGITEAEGQVTSASVDQPIKAEVPMSDLRTENDNDVIMERTSGPGRLYYSVFLRYFLPTEQIQALDRGIVVQRQYYLPDDGQDPVEGAAVNDVVEVKLTLIAPNDLHYLILEDYLPAGCEAVDTSLRTTSSAVPKEEFILEKEQQVEEAGEVPWWRWDWATHTELHDEKVTLFASYLPRGTYEYTYSIRCTTPGSYKVMPATAYEMYFPDVFGRSGGTSFVVGAEAP
jgi:uncharacterized protein YfaS (alpha-2-macroglobulin family)